MLFDCVLLWYDIYQLIRKKGYDMSNNKFVYEDIGDIVFVANRTSEYDSYHYETLQDKTIIVRMKRKKENIEDIFTEKGLAERVSNLEKFKDNYPGHPGWELEKWILSNWPEDDEVE